MGRLDLPLNDNGKNQASQVQLPFQPNVIYSSPLKRTQETAKIVASDLGLKVSLDNRLIEKSGGDIEGKPYEEIAHQYPEVWNIWETHSLDFIIQAKFLSGESDSDVITRIEKLILELEKKHSDQNILLVTHSGVIQATRYLSGKNKSEIYLTPVPACHFEVLI